MDCGRDGLAHTAGAADHAVEARVVDHLDDRRDAAALVADHLGPGAAELDLGGRVRAVAELVFQALDVDPVALAVRREAGEEEAREAALGLRQHQECVAHRGRHEPFVAGQLVLGAGTAAIERNCGGGVGPYIGATLLFGHPHAAEGTRLVGARGAGSARRMRTRGSAAPTPPRSPVGLGSPGSPSTSSRSGNRLPRRP